MEKKKKTTPEYDLIEVNSNLRGLLKERPKKKPTESPPTIAN